MSESNQQTREQISSNEVTDVNERTDANAELVRFILLPTLFLTVALLGGVRVAAETRALVFVPPPLVALILASLLVALIARARLIDFRAWLDAEHTPIINIAHALVLVALFFASAQAFNSVLPERGLLHGLFAFFFLWTLWNNLFVAFDTRALLRSISVLFGTAFAVKHFLLASLFGTERGLLERVTSLVVEGVSLGAISAPAFAPATGYISFFTLALFILGLALTPRAPIGKMPTRSQLQAAPRALELYERLTPAERQRLRELIEDEEIIAQIQPASGSSSSKTSSPTTS